MSDSKTIASQDGKHSIDTFVFRTGVGAWAYPDGGDARGAQLQLIDMQGQKYVGYYDGHTVGCIVAVQLEGTVPTVQVVEPGTSNIYELSIAELVAAVKDYRQKSPKAQ